jgi:hypothetical protein
MTLDVMVLWALESLLVLLGFGACLFLFFTLKREVDALESRLGSKRPAMETLAKELRSEVDTARDSLRGFERQMVALLPPAPVPGFHLNRRTQALRMHHRGESARQIAASLGVPEREAELLVKVVEMTAPTN